mmetsp:Transcript_299/g.833  ORF Transcript_299/g.833 Transcript_299/m.833 type:complete len:212 (+) Transcript_299:661-1296(+)
MRVRAQVLHGGRRGPGPEHAPDDVGGGDTLRPRDGAVLAAANGNLVNVASVDDARVVAMHDVVDPVRVEDVREVGVVHHVGHAAHNLVHPAAGADRLGAFSFAHQRRAPLARGHRGVVVDANDQVCAHRAPLPEGVHVAMVHQVKYPVHPNPHDPLPATLKLRLRLALTVTHRLRAGLRPQPQRGEDRERRCRRRRRRHNQSHPCRCVPLA